MQYRLHVDYRKYTTINTPIGLFQYTRLPFGVSSAPAIYQRVMDNMLKSIPGVCVYLDDVLISGSTEQEHLDRLNRVLALMAERGFRVAKEKCAFQQCEVNYLGHMIDKNGLHPLKNKVEAIVNAPAPTNTNELKSFLGMCQFYSKFLSNLATVIKPMTQLKKHVVFQWGTAQQTAFNKAKELLQSHKVLVHYDQKKEVILSTDASAYGVGAVLSHIMEDGSERHIAYYSRSMSSAETRYSTLDKEALAIVCGVKRFYQYLFGRKFIITTDHKPLLGLFGYQKSIPHMASSRLQRWCLTMSTYDYELCYRAGKSNGNADALSRLPLPDRPDSVPTPGEVVCMMQHMNNTTSTIVADIRNHTRRDPILSEVLCYMNSSWP